MHRFILLVACACGLVPLTSCEGVLETLPAPSDAKSQARIIASRYAAGDYPGTINSTLGNEHIVYHFTYTNGVTLWALMLLDGEDGNGDYRAQVRASLEKYAADDLYRPEGGDEPIDYLGSMAHATLVYSRMTGDERFLDEALAAAEYFHSDGARTPADLIAYHENPRRGRIWADALFMTMPLMAKAGQVLGDEVYYDDVLHQFAGFRERLRDPETGLYHQGYNWHGDGPTPGFWGRANGWVLVAMAEALRAIPPTHPGRDELLAAYRDLAAALARYQGSSGMWHQLVDRPDSYEETSCTGLFIYGLARGVEQGWLDMEFADVVRDGHRGLTRMLSLNGDIENICPGTGPQDSESDYFNRGPRRNESHGIGPVLLGTYGTLLLEERADEAAGN